MTGASPFDRSPANSSGRIFQNTISAISMQAATAAKANPQLILDMPPARSRIIPISNGPTNPPAYPNME